MSAGSKGDPLPSLVQAEFDLSAAAEAAREAEEEACAHFVPKLTRSTEVSRGFRCVEEDGLLSFRCGIYD